MWIFFSATECGKLKTYKHKISNLFKGSAYVKYGGKMEKGAHIEKRLALYSLLIILYTGPIVCFQV